MKGKDCQMEKPQKIMKRCAAVVMAFILTVSGNGLMVNAATAQTEVTVNAGKVYQNNRPYTGWYSTGGGKSIIRLMESVQRDGAK